MNSIGIDIGKSWCVVCVMDEAGRVLEETKYANTRRAASMFARYAVNKYGPSKCVCESTGNLWQKTYAVNENVTISEPVQE